MNTEDIVYSRLDRALASFLGRHSRLQDGRLKQLEQIIIELSSQLSQGHTCIRLDPDQQALVRASGLISDNHPTPLVLEQNRLYLQRYWHYETRLAEQLNAVAADIITGPFDESGLNRYFPAVDDQTDWQKKAAHMALSRSLCIITGGPGTGKTTTVVKILALLQEQALAAGSPLHIALAAPTGKAAMRLQESINQNKVFLSCPVELRDQLPDKVSTLHRLLKVIPNSPYFRYNADNPLAEDLLVVDEASMIDLALMSKLVDALKPGARLILLGDRDQLASVESGAVLADLTRALPDNTVELKTTFRFHRQIKQLADAVNLGQPGEAWEFLKTNSPNTALLQDNMISYAVNRMRNWIDRVHQKADSLAIITAFNDFQILCATRQGPNSVMDINYRLERELAAQNLVKPDNRWYAGRPVMITQNDPGMQLYNGDIGLCLLDSEQQDRLAVFFTRPDGSIRKILPSRLPHCETVFAMTIHKSQGSEFKEVLLVLPDTLNPVLTRELVYTAITRARNTVHVVAKQHIFQHAVRQKVDRFSGLQEKLT